MKADDANLTPEEYAVVRKHARRSLEAAGALGQRPTPVADVMKEAQIYVADEDVFSESFLSKMRRSLGAKLKSALSKVRGMLDVRGRIAYIDKSLHVVRQTFLKLHEAAHAILPHQKGLYTLVEDCEKTIAPDVSELFDREANVFAAEVLFQLDAFSDQANAGPIGIAGPIALGKKFGASAYASLRQYVAKNYRACAVIVLEPPILSDGHGFVSPLRRVVASPRFCEMVGHVNWPPRLTPDDQIGAAVPILGRRMSRPRLCPLFNIEGTRFECMVEAFSTPYQTFVLIHSLETLTKTTLLLTPYQGNVAP